MLSRLVITFLPRSKHLLFSWLKSSSAVILEPQKIKSDSFQEEELSRSLGAQYATGDQRRNNSRKNEGMEPKQKQFPAVDVTGDRTRSDAVKSSIAKEPGMSGP